MLDLSEVGYVRRITIGSTDPEKLASDDEARTAMDLLNRCLSEPPRGRIIGVEKKFSILNIGEHQVVLQAIVYHLGFARKPSWLIEAQP